MKKPLSETEAECPKIESFQGSNFSRPGEQVWLKPFLHGCLTGQVHALLRYSKRSFLAFLVRTMDDPELQKRLPGFKTNSLRMLRLNVLQGVTYSTASLGLFELLRKRVGASNNGQPPSLYQEACLGLTCGMISAFAWQPIVLAANSLPTEICLSYRQLFGEIYRRLRHDGVLALWRGRGMYVRLETATIMGMLASYDRSLNYLMESRGLSKTSAQISASIISGLSATTCRQLYKHLYVVKNFALKNYHEGIRDGYRDIPVVMAHMLAPGGVFKFYSSILASFGRAVPFYMVQWWIFEKVRALE